MCFPVYFRFAEDFWFDFFFFLIVQFLTRMMPLLDLEIVNLNTHRLNYLPFFSCLCISSLSSSWIYKEAVNLEQRSVAEKNSLCPSSGGGLSATHSIPVVATQGSIWKDPAHVPPTTESTEFLLIQTKTCFLLVPILHTFPSTFNPSKLF